MPGDQGKIFEASLWLSHSKKKLTRKGFSCYNRSMKTTFFHKSFDELVMQGDAVVLCDIHAPYQDQEMIQKAVEYGNRFGIKTVILNELYNQDQFSRFTLKDEKADWKTEKESITKIMYTLAEQFKVFGIHDSNHGSRLKKKTDGGLLIEDIVHMTIPGDLGATVWTTDNEYLLVGEDAMVCHSEEYSRVPGKKPQQIGELWGKRIVIQGHSHLMTESIVYKGGEIYYYCDGGCCLDPKKVLYATSKITTHPRWGRGFFIIMKDRVLAVPRDKEREVITNTVRKNGVLEGKVTTIW